MNGQRSKALRKEFIKQWVINHPNQDDNPLNSDYKAFKKAWKEAKRRGELSCQK
jgi:hypothetical protein